MKLYIDKKTPSFMEGGFCVTDIYAKRVKSPPTINVSLVSPAVNLAKSLMAALAINALLATSDGVVTSDR